MKRYLLEVDDKATAELNEKSFTLNGQPAFGLRVLANEISLEVLPTDKPITQEDLTKAREEGQKEAWELARKISVHPDDGGYRLPELHKIFNGFGTVSGVFNNNTYDEAAQKVKAWEDEKKAIHVGDIVQIEDSGKGVVTQVGGAYCAVMSANGASGTYEKADLKKTGKTADISAILGQIKEA